MEDDIVMSLPRAAQEQYLVGQELVRGDYGRPGEGFMTTRALAQRRGVSIVTAQHIMVGLREQGLIELRGKKYYLSYERQAREHDDRTKLIGVLVPNIKNEFYGAMIKAMKVQALKAGYRVIAMDTAYSREQERTALGLFAHFGVAGVVSSPVAVPEGREIYRDCPIPCVLLSHTLEGAKRSSVQVNSFPVAQKIAKHLVEQGYRRFLYLGTKMSRLVDDDRFLGFQAGLRQEGYELADSDILQMPQGYRSAEPVLRQMLERQTEPVGVFCYHDLIAAELCRVCYRLGRSIPLDVGVVGFDDLPIATSVYPTLTTVQYRITSMADMALQLLFKEIRTGEHKYDNYYVDPNLVVRESTTLAEALALKEAQAGF